MDADGLIDQFYKHIAAHDIAIMEHVEPFAQKFMDRPDEAISDIVAVYDRALDQAYTQNDGHNYRGFVQAMCGGPAEGIPSAVYNAVGAVYPYLGRSQRDKALRSIMSILDNINSLYIQVSHTPNIREPLLLGDILALRAHYFPGVDTECRKFEKMQSFFDCQNDLMDGRGLFRPKMVKSDFLMAVSLLHSDFSEWGEQYAKSAHQGFLDRVCTGLAAFFIGFGGDEERVARQTNNCKKGLPVCLHERIDAAIARHDWVVPQDFEPHRFTRQ